APDVEIQLNELLRMQRLLQRLLAKHTGQPLERIAKDFERDYFMDPKTAVEYGIIDKVLGEPILAEEEAESQPKPEEEKQGA
ncbi:MAG: ATP-dependent Clp protease proteolytic subunit, partial [Anaerolineae bacterium]|nr:ATP-dependent Clp protease proteolytic subunit [Anaerolineae bacterium]